MKGKVEKTKVPKSDENKVGFLKLTVWQTSAMSKTITVLMLAFLMIYATDTLKVPAAGVSLILLLSKFVDGFTDAVAGFLVDKTKTRLGTARPYEVFIVGLWLSTWLLFSCPASFSTVAKYIWIFVMYCLANAVCTTFINAGNTPYMVRAFKEGQIVKVASYGSIYTIVVAIAFNMFFPALMQKVAGSPAGWSRLIGMFAVPLAAIGLLRMIFVKEKYEVDVTASQKESIKYKDVLSILKTNPYILILALMVVVFNFVTNMGVVTYYFTYIVGNVGLMGVLSVVTIVTIPLPFIFPKVVKRFSVVTIMQAGFILAACGWVLNFFAGDNMPLLMVANLCTGAGTLPASMLMPLAIIQCADFNEWKGNHRMEGTLSSVTSLASKVGAAVGTGALGIILQFVGYTGDVATMPDSAYVAIKLMYSLVPAVLYILTILTLTRYKKLDKMMPQIKEENQAKRDAVLGTENE